MHKFIISPYSSHQLFGGKKLIYSFHTLSKPKEELKNFPERKDIKLDTNVKPSVWNSSKIKTIGKKTAVANPNVIFSMAFQASDGVQLLELET